MKHAYCIIAHHEPIILQKLIEAIDDRRNDIFVLIDKKANLPICNIKAYKSKLIYTPSIDVRWGDISQVKAELMLFETATKYDVYQYYHLLSGVDLPIKSQNYIHDFMDANNGKEFVGYAQNENNTYDLKRKTAYYYFLTKYYRSTSFYGTLCRYVCSLLLHLQQILGYNRNFGVELKKGANWVSITHEFCIYLLSKRDYILKTFKYTLAPDEMFVQTILWQSPFRINIYKFNNQFESCLREIDWERGTPYTWGEQGEIDIQILKESEKLFARKFSSLNMDFINKVRELSK